MIWLYGPDPGGRRCAGCRHFSRWGRACERRVIKGCHNGSWPACALFSEWGILPPVKSQG